MKRFTDLEGKEILYEQGWKFDVFGPGTIKGIEIKQDLPCPIIEILFPDSRTIERQFLPVDSFLERLKKKEIEITDEQNVLWHQRRKQERELVNKPTAEAIKEVSLFSELEPSTLLELLKERIATKGRLNREEAVILLGAIGQSAENEEEIKELFEFLIEQTKATGFSKGKVKYPQKAYSLQLAARFRQEQCGVMAKCLIKAAEIATARKNKEMLLQIKERAGSLQCHSSRIIKRTAKAVLQYLKEKGW